MLAYTTKERADVLAALEANGDNVKRTSRATGVPATTVRRWRDDPRRYEHAEGGDVAHAARVEQQSRKREGDLNRKIVRKLRSSGGNIAATSRSLHVSRARVKRLHGHTVSGFGERRPPRRATGSRRIQRARVLRDLSSNGENVKAAVRTTGVPEATVRRWRAEQHAVRETVDASAFYASTRRDEQTGCLVWVGQRNPDGYGVTSLGGKSRRAHRVAYELRHKTPLSRDEPLHHVCRNTACVEPAHLLLVDASGERGHNALHRLEDEFTALVAAGELARELNALAIRTAEWPAWLNDREIGSLQAADVAQ